MDAPRNGRLSASGTAAGNGATPGPSRSTVVMGAGPGGLCSAYVLSKAGVPTTVLEKAPFVGGLLGACPALTVLATSREPLSLLAEERFPVAPLALPDRATLEEPRTLASGGRRCARRWSRGRSSRSGLGGEGGGRRQEHRGQHEEAS